MNSRETQASFISNGRFCTSYWALSDLHLSLIGFGLLVSRIVRYILDRKEWHKRWDICYKENERLETRKQEILTESRAYLMTVSTAEYLSHSNTKKCAIRIRRITHFFFVFISFRGEAPSSHHRRVCSRSPCILPFF